MEKLPPELLVIVIQLLTAGILIVVGFVLKEVASEMRSVRSRLHKVEGAVAVHSALLGLGRERPDQSKG